MQKLFMKQEKKHRRTGWRRVEKNTNSVTLSSQYLEKNVFSETWHDATLIRCAEEHLPLFYVNDFFKKIDIDDKAKVMFYL